VSNSLSTEEKTMPQKGKKTRRARKLTSLPENLKYINLDAAGIDVGSEYHYVAVPEGRDENGSVRRFGTFTEDLEEIADWFEKCGVTTVAMESTGVYWIPLYEVLDRRGFEVNLVDARHVRNVSGRKSDILDCQWVQQLHTFGLLRGAFRPTDEISVLRSYVRQKEMLTQAASMHIQHMQKALQQMNVLLHNVVSDITGLTGMTIIKAIVAGERDPNKLASNRHENCRNSEETIAKSLKGNYREEHVFGLKQAVELYEFYQGKISECEKAVVGVLSRQPDATDEELPPDGKNIRTDKRMRAGMDVRDKLFKMCGVDLFNAPGLGTETLLVLGSEAGFDMSPWKTEKHFTSWLGLCPGTKITGGKRVSRKTKRTKNRAAQAFRMAAASLARSQSALGAYYRRIQARKGGIHAVTATAHKLARIFYAMLKNKTQYVELGQQAYEEQYKRRRIMSLLKQAKSLGYNLTPCEG
jgi:transposase